MRRTTFKTPKSERKYIRKLTEYHIKLIAQVSWSFHYTTGIDFEELQGEATLAFYESQIKYNPNKGASPETFAYNKMKSRLLDYINRKQKIEFIPASHFTRQSDEEEYTNIFEKNGAVIEDQYSWDFMDQFSSDVQSIIQDIMDNKILYLELPAYKNRKTYTKQLLANRGFSVTQINKIMDEMSKLLRIIV